MNGAPKKLHHSVPRFYLKAWAKGGKVHCLQGGRIRADVLRNLGSQNYFYCLQELGKDDIAFLQEFIKDSPEGLRQSHEFLLHAMTLPHRAKRILELRGLEASEEMAEINRQIVEVNENFHTGIEDNFKPYLSAMISGDLTFLESPENSASFYHALSVQYARTNHLNQMRKIMDRSRFELYCRVMPILTHLVANNVGLSLYAERELHKVILLDNVTSVPFITADQPLINLGSGPKDTEPPKKFELYYPVSPNRAMLLLQPSSEFSPNSAVVSEMYVRSLNLRMVAHSYRQVYSLTVEPLEQIQKELRAYLGCF